MGAPTAVCLSPIPWKGLWTSRHELCSELARRGWEVVFVDPPVNAARTFRFPTLAEGPLPEGLKVVAPPHYLPYGVLGRFGGRVVAFNAERYAGFLGRKLREAFPGRGVDLLLNSFMPVHGYKVQARVAPRVSVYHRSDELRQFPGWKPTYSVLEARVAADADLVMCVSERVREGIRDVRPDAVVIPNGVDTQPFHQQSAPDPELARLSRPISVMVGVFDRRVDPALLDAAASVSNLVLVGRVEGTRVPAGAHFLGPVPHERIPAILAVADVGLVCYRPGWAGDVLKIYEYLAAGLPVVSSHRPETASVRGEVVVASEPASFADAVRKAVAERTTEGDTVRRAVAEANSWSHRVDRLLELSGYSEKRSLR